MTAMIYEYTMRRAYHCGRNYTKGADADIYRALERENVKSRNLDEPTYDYRSAFAVVRGHLLDALVKSLPHLTETARSMVASHQALLSDFTFLDKDRLDEIISNLHEALKISNQNMG